MLEESKPVESVAVVAEEPVVEAPVVAETPEAVVTPPPAAAPVVDKFASKFAALTRKDRDIAAREKALQERLAAIETREKEIQTKYSPFEEVNKLLEQQDHYGAAKKLNLDLTKLAEGSINEKVPGEWEPEINELKSQLAKLQAAADEKEKLIAKQNQEAYESKLQNFTSTLTNYVKEAFPLIATKEEGIPVVIGLMERVYQSEGKLLSNAEACQLVNEMYLDEVRKAMSIPGIKQLFGVSQSDGSNIPPAQPATTGNPSSNLTQVESAKQQVKDEPKSKRPPALGNKGTAATENIPDLSKLSPYEQDKVLAQMLRERNRKNKG
jgi:hypothetical protein